MAHGVRAFVTDAAVRDTADLNEMGFPVWSQYVSCEGTVKATPGSVNVPIRFGEAIVHPGDIVCCDDDGVVIVPRAEAAWAADQAQARLDKEAGTRARLEAKEIGLDIYGLREAQIAMGVEYLDSAADL
jgi:4-hydroxy-4-methyl-2-oxoglutarate aldolase